VGFIRPKSKTLGLACQTGPELKHAYLGWSFSDGGHIFELANELFYVLFPSKIQELEVVPVTRWCLTRLSQSLEG